MTPINADELRAQLKREGWEEPICEVVETLLKAVQDRECLIVDLVDAVDDCCGCTRHLPPEMDAELHPILDDWSVKRLL